MGHNVDHGAIVATDRHWGPESMNNLVLILTAALLGTGGHAAEFHVAVDGDDAHPGTHAQPFATLQRGHEAAAPGDTVFVHGGTYAVTGERAAGIVLSKILERLTLHDNQGPGLFIDGGTGGHLVLNCDSYNNYDPHSVTGPGQNADGFGCHYQKPGPSTVFRGCRAWWNSDDGYDWFKQEVPVIIEHCWAMGSGYTPNGAELAASGNGAGFKIGNTFTGVRQVVRNCVSIKNKAQGFYANHSHGGSDWFNNTAYANRGAAFDMLSDIVLSGTNVHRLRNNIALPATIRNPGASDMQHNSWDLGITVTDDDFQSVLYNGFMGPRNPDGGLPDLEFLKRGSTRPPTEASPSNQPPRKALSKERGHRNENHTGTSGLAASVDRQFG